MSTFSNNTTPPKMEAPLWFRDAINTPYKVKTIEVDGCAIEYYLWGDSSKPLLMLVHGNGGHANWWDFIAPSFTDDYCVCSLHLGGMGNSGHRKEYTFEHYSNEVMAVAEDAGYTKDITIIGHSMGGVVTLRAAENYAERIKAIIILDSPLMLIMGTDAQGNAVKKRPQHHDFKGKRYHPSFQSIFERFRLIPTQECKNQFLVEHVGRHSIKKFDEGWSWKFDAGIYSNFKRTKKPISRKKISCHFTYIYGEESALVPAEVIPELKEFLKDLGPVIGLPHAHHHLLLDEPQALITLLKKTLKQWN